MCSGRLTERDIDAVLDWSAAHKIDCLYFLAGADDAETVRVAEEADFHLADIRLTLEASRSKAWSGAWDSRVRPAETRDAPVLKTIAGTAHKKSRFYFDPRLAPKAPALFATWIAKSVDDPNETVFVAEVDGRAVGYVTCACAGKVGTIGLLAVDRHHSRQGLGRALVESALRRFAEEDVETVRITTQGRNLATQRLCQRAGFVSAEVALWYHKWFSPA